MYDNLKEVKMIENNNYKKYMKIFGKDRFSVKLGNFLLLFSIIDKQKKASISTCLII